MGADSFSYTVTDGRGGSASASVNMTTVAGVAGWTNLLATTEANIRGGSYADTDVDEASQGYLMVKYNSPNLSFARKAGFQFDLTDWDVNVNTQATLTVSFTTNFKQRVQLWALSQAAPGFASDLTWNNAPANDTNSNALLTSGPFTAMPVGASQIVPTNGTADCVFILPRLGDYLFNHRVTLVLAGVNDPANNSGGLRLQRTNATLQVLAVVGTLGTPAVAPAVTGLAVNADGTVGIGFLGGPGQTYLVQAATNLAATVWLTLATNVAATNGVGFFSDPTAASHPMRFYRSTVP